MSEGLESSLGPNVDNLIVEAEDILEMLKSRNFEESQNATVDEYSACEDCKLKKIQLLSIIVTINLKQ